MHFKPDSASRFEADVAWSKEPNVDEKNNEVKDDWVEFSPLEKLWLFHNQSVQQQCVT